MFRFSDEVVASPSFEVITEPTTPPFEVINEPTKPPFKVIIDPSNFEVINRTDSPFSGRNHSHQIEQFSSHKLNSSVIEDKILDSDSVLFSKRRVRSHPTSYNLFNQESRRFIYSQQGPAPLRKGNRFVSIVLFIVHICK